MPTLQDSHGERPVPARNEWLFTAFELALFVVLTPLLLAATATAIAFFVGAVFNDTGRPIGELTAQMPGFFASMLLAGAGPGFAAGVTHSVLRHAGIGHIARIFGGVAAAFAIGLAQPLWIDYGELKVLTIFAALLLAAGAAGAGLFLMLADMRRRKKRAV